MLHAPSSALFSTALLITPHSLLVQVLRTLYPGFPTLLAWASTQFPWADLFFTLLELTLYTTWADHLLPLWRKRSLQDQLPKMESGRKEGHCHHHLRRRRAVVKSQDIFSFSPCLLFVWYYLLSCFVCGSVRIYDCYVANSQDWLQLLLLIYYLFYLQDKYFVVIPCIIIAFGLVCTHPPIVVTPLTQRANSNKLLPKTCSITSAPNTLTLGIII